MPKSHAPGQQAAQNATDERGERLIWLPRAMLDRPNRLQGPAESYSDVIVKLVETEGACGL